MPQLWLAGAGDYLSEMRRWRYARSSRHTVRAPGLLLTNSEAAPYLNWAKGMLQVALLTPRYRAGQLALVRACKEAGWCEKVGIVYNRQDVSRSAGTIRERWDRSQGSTRVNTSSKGCDSTRH